MSGTVYCRPVPHSVFCLNMKRVHRIGVGMGVAAALLVIIVIIAVTTGKGGDDTPDVPTTRPWTNVCVVILEILWVLLV